MDLDQCACSGKTLGRLLQPAIMGLLSREPLHGYLILQRLEEMPMFQKHRPDPTGVYRLLKAMEEANVVAATWDLADSGPARRRFELTPVGQKCLGRWLQTLREYVTAVDDLLERLGEDNKATKRPSDRATKGKTRRTAKGNDAGRGSEQR